MSNSLSTVSAFKDVRDDCSERGNWLYRLRVIHVDWLQVLENMEMIDVFIPFRHIFLPPFEFTFKIAS